MVTHLLYLLQCTEARETTPRDCDSPTCTIDDKQRTGTRPVHTTPPPGNMSTQREVDRRGLHDADCQLNRVQSSQRPPRTPHSAEKDDNPHYESVTDRTTIKPSRSGGSNNNPAHSTTCSSDTDDVTDQLIADRPAGSTIQAPTANTNRSCDDYDDGAQWAPPEFMKNIDYPYLDGERQAMDIGINDDGDILEALYPPDASLPPTDTVTASDHSKWPYPTLQISTPTASLYEEALQAKLKGMPPPRLDHTTSLNVKEWAAAATGHPADDLVLRGIKHGFSVQYQGPPCYAPPERYNHSSATSFPDHINKYVQEELAHGALEGPFEKPPFTPWFHVSPMMTREKTDSDSRRVIVDLSFPHGGINAHIPPHTFDGRDVLHNLPTIESAVGTIATTCPGDIRMAVVDLSRAYRHFPVSPLDWPLLGLYWDGGWAFDRRLPFGSRMSSFAMQTTAEFIVRALKRLGITTHMYLDDIIMISPSTSLANTHYNTILGFLERLGLQVAVRKLQPPHTRVKWLGITIDLKENSLSIPAEKLAQIKLCMATASRKKSITRRTLQRLIGLANHLAKVVRAARVFVCRLLAALRAATSNYIKVTQHVRADLAWFARYLHGANGRAILPNNMVVMRIWVDACLQGAGASDGHRCYEHVFDEKLAADHHITQLEALNCLAAARTFVTKEQAGGTIQIFCDNQPSVDALTSGRARDDVLAACARAFWHHAARTDTNFIFAHVSGSGMALPDALSRASLSHRDRSRADQLIRARGLIHVSPPEGAYHYKMFS